MTVPKNLFLEIVTPLTFTVRVTLSYWHLIVTIKHPVMANRDKEVQKTLENPDEIRVSRSDSKVFLFYKAQRPDRWTCAVTKRLDGEGFLITTYPTDAIKEGERIWPK